MDLDFGTGLAFLFTGRRAALAAEGVGPAEDAKQSPRLPVPSPVAQRKAAARVRIDASFIDVSRGDDPPQTLQFKFKKNAPYSVGGVTQKESFKLEGGDFSITSDTANLVIRKVQFDK